MRTCYRVLKGGHCESDLVAIPGVKGAWTNPFGAGADVVEVEHDRDPFEFPKVVKDRTIGNVILECLRKPKDERFTYRVEVESEIREYEGFAPLDHADSALLHDSFLVVIAFDPSVGTSIWAVEDEQGFRQLQKKFKDDGWENTQYVAARPFIKYVGNGPSFPVSIR